MPGIYKKNAPPLVFQYGSGVSNSDDAQVFSFPFMFPNACHGVTITRTEVAQFVLPVTAKTRTNFTINRSDAVDGSNNFDWLAVGD